MINRIEKNLANIITGIGLMAVIFFIALLSRGYNGAPMIIAISIIALTDLLDGAIARWLKIVSRFGKSLDRFRDKLFACTLFAFKLVELSKKDGLVFVLIWSALSAILIFELGLIVTWIFGLKKKLDVSAHIWGKRKMWFYFFASYLFFMDKYIISFSSQAIFNCMLFIFLSISALLAFLSLWGYIERFFPSKT